MMHTRTLKSVSAHSGPIVLGGGMALLAVALVGPGHARPVAQAPPAATATPSPGASTPAVPSPHPSPRPSSAVVVADRETAGSPGRGGDRTGPAGDSRSGAESTGRPSPSPAPPAGGSSGGLALSARAPLGVLPEVGVDVTIRGEKSR